MSEKQRSPFAGLDKALLRSTREQRSLDEAAAVPEEDVSAALPGRTDDTTRTETATLSDSDDTDARTPDRPAPSKRARTPARPDTRTRTQAADAPDDAALIETIRRAVKVAGKDVSFTRLTAEEKQHLADVVYTYKRQGKKTTENEVVRIAVNLLLEDYRTSGEHSVLARVIDSLLA